jgi:hypothetical protein
MSLHPTTSEPDAAAAQRAAHAQYYLRVLHRLIDIGVTLAEQVEQQALPKTGAAVLGCDETGAALKPSPELTQAYERVTRSIRRSIMLARAIEAPAPVRDTGAQDQSRIRARKRIIRTVEDTIERVTEADSDDTRGDALRAEMFERLDRPDMDDDIDHRPLEEIIDEIRHDMGLTGSRDSHHWKRRTPADVALLYTRAAAPLSATQAVPVCERGDRAEWGWPSDGEAHGPGLRGNTPVTVRDG